MQSLFKLCAYAVQGNAEGIRAYAVALCYLGHGFAEPVAAHEIHTLSLRKGIEKAAYKLRQLVFRYGVGRGGVGVGQTFGKLV